MDSRNNVRRMALLMVRRALIVVNGSVMCRADGGELSVAVFAALVALERGGHLQRGDGADAATRKRCFVRLTPTGTQLLLLLEHEAAVAKLALGA
jgi:hypothetical protein